MDPQALTKAYPFLDYMMAETLIKAHENGTLAEYIKDWPDQTPQPMGSQVIPGAVTVNKKCL